MSLCDAVAAYAPEWTGDLSAVWTVDRGAEACRGEAMMGELVLIERDGREAVVRMSLPQPTGDALDAIVKTTSVATYSPREIFLRDGDDAEGRPRYKWTRMEAART